MENNRAFHSNSHNSHFRYNHCTLAKYMKGYNIGRDESSFNLLSRMLSMDPKKRINSFDALCHPYFNELPHPEMDVFSCFPKVIPFPHRKYLSEKIEPIKFEQKARITRKTHLQERNI